MSKREVFDSVVFRNELLGKVPITIIKKILSIQPRFWMVSRL